MSWIGLFLKKEITTESFIKKTTFPGLFVTGIIPDLQNSQGNLSI